MGIPGILKEIGKGERVALSKLAIEHFERHNRPLRVAIDVAIWNFQTQSAQGGKNPALRTLFFRLLRLLALPIQPVFVYDGKNKPLMKRGRLVSRYYGTCVPNELSKGLVKRFSYPWHVAPGEAEAECALLQRKGIVDMVMSQDVDAIMFGAGVTLRDWSKEGTRGNKAPTHVNVMNSIRLAEISGLDSQGMILVALLSGGDYDEAGVPGFGAALACEIARAGFGKDLIDLVQKKDWSGLGEWRERLRYELETNESGYFKRRHKTLILPETFPDEKILGYYLQPAVSKDEDLPELESKWTDLWASKIDVPALRAYTAIMFDWQWRSGARRFVRCFAQPLFQDRLRRGGALAQELSVDSIIERRHHFTNDGIAELRVAMVPADVVGIDIDAEDDNPEWTTTPFEEDEEVIANTEDTVSVAADGDCEPSLPVSPSKKRKSPLWEADVPEKWWIPETLLLVAVPAVVEDWHQLQRDIRADPKRFATRKLPRAGRIAKQIDSNMKSGAIREFFTHVTKQSDATRKTAAIKEGGGCGENHRSTASVLPRTLNRRRPEPGDSDTLSSITHMLATGESHDPRNHNRMAGAESSSLLHSSDQCPQLPDDHTNGHSSRPTSCNTKDGGNLFSTAIVIDCSPSIPSGKLLVADMVNVTQRKPRRNRNQFDNPPSSPAASPSRKCQPISTFFTQTNSTVAKGAGSLGVKKLPPSPEPINKSSSRFQSTAQARESLPGTWKEMHPDLVCTKRPPRISYVDLTSE